MKQTISVTVIVPNYNHAAYLPRRIDSILQQTFTDFELILLDDCSTDGSKDILRSYQHHPQVSQLIFNETNSGSPFLQWEKGIQLARGKYIWIAESDDDADPEFLATAIRQLELHPNARVCITGSQIINEHGDIQPNVTLDTWKEDRQAVFHAPDSYLAQHMLKTNSVYNASMTVFRKEGALTGINDRYRQMRYCGDWLFWVEQIKKGGIVEIHRKLNYFRQHSTNTTSQGASDGKSLPEIAYIKSYLYRQGIMDQKKIRQDKYEYYLFVKNYPVSSPQRTRALLKEIAREGITFWSYRWWKAYLSYTKHIKPLFHSRQA